MQFAAGKSNALFYLLNAEPTSGLDSLSASLVVSSLQRAAKSRGVTVVCTIHQPSREVFETFDNLLLLRKGGCVVYNGPIDGISQYMTCSSGSDEYALTPGTNPADHALDIFCGPGGEKHDWGDLYKRSEMAKDVATDDTTECVWRVICSISRRIARRRLAYHCLAGLTLLDRAISLHY